MKRAIVALLLALPLSAFAQGYAGIGFGQTTFKDVPDCDFTLSCDDSDSGFKIFGGYQFNKNLALEGGYADLGKTAFSEPGFSGKVDATTIFVHAVGILPLNPQWSLYGKAGLHLWDAKENGQIGGIPFSLSDDGTDLTYGAGVQWQSGKFALRLEWETYELDNADVQFLGVSGVMRF